MSWSNRQKFLVHLYADAAKLPEQHYRQVLFDVSGCRTAAHRALTQFHFDQVMARLEARLDYAIAEGLVDRPPAKWISDLHHWRRRLPATGGTNTRQAHLVQELWDDLRPRLAESKRTDAYLCAIASRACACRVESRWGLPAWQTELLIDALRDLLHYAVRRGGVAA